MTKTFKRLPFLEEVILSPQVCHYDMIVHLA